SPQDFIVGGGLFGHFTTLPISLAWETFGVKNGVGSLDEMRRRVIKYRRGAPDPREDFTVGCILLEEPFFLPEESWVRVPPDWSFNIVRGKGYDLERGGGLALWQALHAPAPA